MANVSLIDPMVTAQKYIGPCEETEEVMVVAEEGGNLFEDDKAQNTNLVASAEFNTALNELGVARMGGRINFSGLTTARLLDQDEPMGGEDASSSQQYRHQPYNPRSRPGRSRGSDRRPGVRWSDSIRGRLGPVAHLNSNDHHLSNFGSDLSQWFRVRVLNGKRLEKDFILKSIASLSTLPFNPVGFSTETSDATFFVRGSDVAKAIHETSGRIILADSGTKMMLHVNKHNSAPPVTWTPEVVEKLKVAMSQRYDVGSSSLDLSSFGQDKELQNEGIYMVRWNANYVDPILQIIAAHIPEMTNERELLAIRSLGLLELHLEGNELCNRFNNKQQYISAIRKIFPKITKLDGQDLPPPITFDIEAPTALPPPLGNHFGGAEFQDRICCFIDQYFTLYDSDRRQDLLSAYHDDAKFSLSIYNNKSTSKNNLSLDGYMSHSRNLKQLSHDRSQRENRLKSGSLNIVALLTKLPATQHDPQSFVVDVNLATLSTLSFTINGLFRETSSRNQPVRHFTRTFITVPNGPGIAIMNEMLSLTNASPEVAQAFLKRPVVPSAAASSMVAPAFSDAQLQFVKQLSAVSGMNEEFSARCLMENQWDYTKATQVFMELKARNGVPPEAFRR